MTWVATAVVGSAIIGGAMQSRAAKKAAQGQTQAADASIAEQRRQFDITQQNLQPWLQAGQAGLGRMRDLMGLGTSTMTPEQVMEQSPGYQFRLQEGQNALGNQLGAMGLRNSGAALKAGTRFGQNYASNEFQNIYNRLAGISGAGMTTGTNMGQFGAQNAGAIGNLMTGAANARGAAAIGGANAWSGALNRGTNYFTQQSMLNQLLGARGGMGGMSSTPYTGGYGWGNV